MTTLMSIALPLAQSGRGANPDSGTGLGEIAGTIVIVIAVLALLAFVVTRLSMRSRGRVGSHSETHERGRVGRIWGPRR
ncbi:MAG: hypothetical protein ACJ76V_14000 [Thermoleophilaceae bacterium]